MGYAVMGTATAKGEHRATDVAQRAIASPLLEAGAIDGARGILINITGSSSLKLAEVNEASTIIQSAAHEDANIIFGAVLDEKMKDEVKITVIATGFRGDNHVQRHERAVSAAAAAISQARTASAYISPRPEIRAAEPPPQAALEAPKPAPPPVITRAAGRSPARDNLPRRREEHRQDQLRGRRLGRACLHPQAQREQLAESLTNATLVAQGLAMSEAEGTEVLGNPLPLTTKLRLFQIPQFHVGAPQA